MKKGMLILVAALVASLSIVGVANAKEFEGTGVLVAEGRGKAVVEGTGTVVVYGHGVGVLWIKDADHIEVRGEGYRDDLGNGWIRYRALKGMAIITGNGMKVRMIGGWIHFRAWGTGTVTLKGRGTYRVNGIIGHWSAMGTVLRLEE